MMTSDELASRVIDTLNASGLAYMTVGSLSTNFYGIPRSTRDADFVVQASAESITDLARRLGPPFRLDPQLSFETITGTSRYVFTVSDSPFRIEIFLLSDDPHDQSRFGRRVVREVEGRALSLPTAEDVIITKLRWSRRGKRQKDLDDVRNVIGVQYKKLDWPYIESWCVQHGTRELLDQICASLPPNL
jgi:hypothetical protein